MKKILLIIGWMVSYYSLYAQSDSSAVELSEIIINENRLQIPFNKTSRNIGIIGRKEIETTPARSLQEILSFTPGVDVRQRGVSGVQANIGIRGGNFEQTLMLINGIKLTDPQTGHHMMNIPIPLQAIQRVEVLKGPASRIYGQNAYAGAINVVTTLADTKSLNFQGYGGDFGMRGASLVTSLPIGTFRQTISASHDASDGHWYNSDFKVSNLFYEGGFALNEDNEIKIMAAMSDRSFGANGFYTNAFPDQWESVQTYLSALSHTYAKNDIYLQTRAYWRRNVDEFRLRRNEPQFSTNNHISDVFALELNGSYTSIAGMTGFGIEGRREEIDSNNIGLRQRAFLGLFAEHRIAFGDGFDFRAGIYANYYDEYGWKPFPGAELGYQLSNHSRLYTNYGVSYRIPSFTELYYEDPSNLSNPNLEPEQAQNFEIGYRFHKERFRFETNYFYRYTQNLIDWTRSPSEAIPNPNQWQPRNISQVTFHGLETGFIYAMNAGSRHLRLTEVSFSYNYIDAALIQAEGVESRYSLNSLRHQLIGGIQTEIVQRSELTVKARYLERMALEPYFLLDARIDYNRLKTLGFFAEASNITNAEYIEAGFVQMPGRWFRAGISINLE
ncbi:TonB-dependent receptor [Anditalea andensis]|uniref:TonB-dependent receptor n=1 Tax=Anditalea andensis TaxID=1048983 RepID=A0A074LG96_9BACT|nr:TonB-dependent receptor [Anditalea andensis]KEO72817.1 TonB-dependent receptor [Anditalea andensis]